LIGYTDRPSEAQLVVYLFTVALIVTLMYAQRRSRAATSRPAVVEITSRS
jgi:high-affinity Fe2+/Pb2+ permease